MNMSERYPGEMLSVKVIPLTRSKFAIIDPEDYELVSQYKWRSLKHRSAWYAVASIPHPDGGYDSRGWRRYTTRSMHQLITGYPETDHQNGNGLDNRRCNLRPATSAQNAANRKRRSDNTSGHVGITWHKRYMKWQARIGYNGIQYHLGNYDRIQDAIAAYHVAAQSVFQEFASHCCNASPQLRN